MWCNIGGSETSAAVVYNVYSCMMVNQIFKNILEKLKPDVHPFFPMAVMIKGEKMTDHYWLNICNRLETHHPTLCHPQNKRVFFKPVRGQPSAKVFSVEAIGGNKASGHISINHLAAPCDIANHAPIGFKW